MTCEEVRSRLSWYIDDELDPGEAEAIREHLHAGCEGCRARLTELRASDREIREALKDVRPSAGFVSRVAAKVRPKPSPWPKRILWAAAALVMVFIGVAVYVNNAAPPPLMVSIHGSEGFHADSLGALRVFVTNAANEMPVAQAAVRVLLAGKEVGKFLTNAAGTVDGFFRVPDLKDGAYSLHLEVETPLGSETLARMVTVKREYRLLLSTDKPMYQPGQAIQMRALALNAFTLKPRPGDGEFEVMDSKGNKIFTKKAKLSDFGIASAELLLADEINLGPYRVAITASGLRQERTVEVAKYVLPKFKVELELEKPSYRPREVVRGKVKASYYFGKAVQGRAKATVGREVVSGDLREDGSWEFQAPAPEADGLTPVEVTITDTADHRETKTTGAVVSREPLKVMLYPEGGLIVAGVENTFYLLVSYPDGRPAKADLTLVVNDKITEASTDDLGVAKIQVGPPHRVRLDRARDKNGNETREMERPLSPGTNDFTIRLDKAAYRAGETMTVKVIGNAPEPVYIDVVKGGQLLLAKAVDPLDSARGKQGEVAIDLPPDLFGTVQVIAYKRSSQMPVVRVAYVNLPEGLRIRPRVAKESFRPGEEMPVDLEVVDKDGKPIQAALGISVVDEALFGLIESKIASEKAWLSLAPELIDTRGFLKADANEIYQGKAPNAQGFVSGNSNAPILRQLVGNDYFRKLDEIRRRAADFNEVAGTIIKIVVTLSFIGLIVAGLVWVARRTGGAFASICVLGMACFILIVLNTSGEIYRARDAPVAARTAERGEVSGHQYGLRTGDRSGGAIPSPVTAPSAAPSPEMAPPKSEPKLAAEEGGDIIKRSTHEESDRTRGTASNESQTLPATREPARIREYFPETLYWMPELITDEKGHVRLTLPAADSITSWRMLASAIARTGALGFEQANLKVFQDFFVDIDFPVALTKGDRVHVPVAVYNYLKEPQTVTVRAQKEAWFELLDEETKSIALKPGEVSVVYFGLRVKEHGRKALTVFAEGKVKDAIKRTVEVMEKGREMPISASDRVMGRHTFKVAIPDRAIEGSAVLFARLTPGAGDLVTGLQGMIRMPYG